MKKHKRKFYTTKKIVKKICFESFKNYAIIYVVYEIKKKV